MSQKCVLREEFVSDGTIGRPGDTIVQLLASAFESRSSVLAAYLLDRRGCPVLTRASLTASAGTQPEILPRTAADVLSGVAWSLLRVVSGLVKRSDARVILT